jgi:hypothetical protein
LMHGKIAQCQNGQKWFSGGRKNWKGELKILSVYLMSATVPEICFDPPSSPVMV